MRFSSEAELTQWARQALRLWLFLDYDGTLADFAPTPDNPVPDRHVVELMGHLASDEHRRVAVISGRKLADVQALLPIGGLFLGGTYGLELQLPSGEIIMRADYHAVRPMIERVKSRWQSLIAGHAGLYLEDKGLAVALHARFAPQADADSVLPLARQSAQEILPAKSFRILGGNRFLEVGPLLAHKGEAVAFLLHQLPWPEAQCLYIGDDDKDEEAFETIHACGGATVAVTARNPCPPSADYCLDSPEAVRRWLAHI